MFSRHGFYLISRFALLSFIGIFTCGYAAQQPPKNDQQEVLRKQRKIYSKLGFGARQSSLEQRLDELNWINEELEKLDPTKSGMSPEEIQQQVQALRDLKKNIIDALQSDNKYGRAIASGLAGKDCWEALQGEPVKDVWEGVRLGTTMRISRACSDALGKRMENSIDRIFGGIWDAFISTFIDSWSALYQNIFHEGAKPLKLKEIKGWQDTIKKTFDDIGVLLKDGLKDSLRGHDMTLRQAPSDEVTDAEEELINPWDDIVQSYVRQFNHIVCQLDKHLIYYEGNDNVEYHIEEIKYLLFTINKILLSCKSLKELDTLLSSNKSIIPALRNTTQNQLVRLTELVEPQGSSSSQSTMRSSASDSGSRESRSNRFDDNGSRSFGGF